MCFLQEASFLKIFLQISHSTSMLWWTSRMCLLKFTTVLLHKSHQLFLPRNTAIIDPDPVYHCGAHAFFLLWVSKEDLFLNTPAQTEHLSSWLPECTSLRCLFMPLGCSSLRHTSHWTLPSGIQPRRETIGQKWSLLGKHLGLVNIMFSPEVVL